MVIKMKEKFAALLMSLAAALSPVSSEAEPVSLPIAENMEIVTQINTGVTGRLSAADEDGGELIFYVTTEPVKGKLTLEKDGEYRYCPDKDRKGRDYFGYRVKDNDGNVSQEATVIIKLEK